jgi:hypothetical protein
MKHCASVPKMSDFWTLNPRSTQIPLTYQHKNSNIYKIHHSESTPGISMSIEHHHSVLFTIHEQSMMVRLDWEITLSALLSLRLICIWQNWHTQASAPLSRVSANSNHSAHLSVYKLRRATSVAGPATCFGCSKFDCLSMLFFTSLIGAADAQYWDYQNHSMTFEYK